MTKSQEILIAMHNLGGQVTRKQMLQELHDNSKVFSEKEIDEVRTSKKGHTVDIDGFDADRNVRSISESKMPHRKTTRVKVNSVSDSTNSNQGDSEDLEEPWRQQLLDALIKMSPKKFEL